MKRKIALLLDSLDSVFCWWLSLGQSFMQIQAQE